MIPQPRLDDDEERNHYPERADEMAHFLSTLYNREVGVDDVVTVIRFSQILSGPVAPPFLDDDF